MVLSYGPNLGLLINAATGEAHADALRACLRGLDGLVMPSVLDRTNTPPVSPANGDRYLLGASPTGAWAGNANKIARYNGSAWEFYTPINGWSVVVVDESTVYRYLSGAWTAAITSGSSSISGTLSVDNGSVAYTATRTGQIATIKSGTLSTTELLFGMRSTGIPAIQSARSTDDAAQELQLQPFGGSTRIGSGIVSSGVGSGDLIVVGGTSVGGALSVGGAGYFAGNVGIGTTASVNKLDVWGDVAIRNSYVYKIGGAGDTLVGQIGNDSGVAYFRSDGTRNLALGSGTVGNALLINGSTGNVGLATTAPTNILSFGGNSARTIWMERHTTSNSAGNNLTLQAGGATSGATDKNGGTLTLAPGVSTNKGFSSVKLQGLTRAASTGTTDNTLVDRIIVPSEFNLSSGVAGSLFEVALPTLIGSGGIIEFAIFATNGTDVQVYSGHVTYALANKGGVYTNTITEHDPVTALSTGTLTTSWAATAGTNKVTIAVTATSSLTPTTFKIRYILKNLGGTAITQL